MTEQREKEIVESVMKVMPPKLLIGVLAKGFGSLRDLAEECGNDVLATNVKELADKVSVAININLEEECEIASFTVDFVYKREAQ